MADHLLTGVDLGGTKISAVVLDKSGDERERKRIATPREDYAGTIRAIAALVSEIEADAGNQALSHGVGIGTPGSIDPATGLIQNANSTWLNGMPLQADLETALKRPVRLANDANCLALSEATDGAAAGASSVFAVILGTGVGGGLVANGALVGGPMAIAGEWGHTPLPIALAEELPGPRCWCGRFGCIEAWLSGPGLAADHARETGESVTAEIIAAAETPERSATLERYIDRLARALAVVVNIVDPATIVLGGGMSNVARLRDELPARITPHVFSDTPRVSVVCAKHGDDSGVRGAARLFADQAAAAGIGQ